MQGGGTLYGSVAGVGERCVRCCRVGERLKGWCRVGERCTGVLQGWGNAGKDGAGWGNAVRGDAGWGNAVGRAGCRNTDASNALKTRNENSPSGRVGPLGSGNT